MKLNIGCSADPWGDIKLDIAPYHLKMKSQANIFADAQHLPFKDKVFEETRAWNILEHLPDWEHSISEWCRVTDKKISIEVPVDPGYVNREIFAELLSLNFYFLLKLPSRRRKHLWKFNPAAIGSKLRDNNFDAEYSFNSAPLLFRDDNRLSKNKFIDYLRRKQKRIHFGYRITAHSTAVPTT